MKDSEQATLDVDALRKVVLSRDAVGTRQWFESHAFSTSTQGEDVMRFSSNSRNELVNLLVEAVQIHSDESFGIMLQYTCHNNILHHARDIDDRRLSDVVLCKGTMSCLKTLTQFGYNINITDAEGMTPLLYVIYKKSVSRVKDYKDKLDFMLKNGADVNKQGGHNWAFAPLHIAVLYSSGTETMKKLIDAGADVNLQCNNSLSTPLFFAVERSSPEMVDLLLEYKADPSILDVLGDSPLHLATVQQRKGSALLKAFVRWNTPMDIQNISGQTPLMWCLSNWKTVKRNRIQMLLQAGATCDQSEWWGIRQEEATDPKLDHKLLFIEDLLESYSFRPRSLHDLVCFKIRGILGRDVPNRVPLLPIPDCLKKRIHLDHYFGKIDIGYFKPR